LAQARDLASKLLYREALAVKHEHAIDRIVFCWNEVTLEAHRGLVGACFELYADVVLPPDDQHPRFVPIQRSGLEVVSEGIEAAIAGST
jgi:hypothetical protein